MSTLFRYVEPDFGITTANFRKESCELMFVMNICKSHLLESIRDIEYRDDYISISQSSDI